MGFSFSNSTIENLKNQINIIDVVGRVVPLKRAGSNYKGVCPFHNEKTPSFVVSEQKQIFTCFGCGATGDAIEFAKRYYNLDFSEAVEKLAGEYGISLEKTPFTTIEKSITRLTSWPQTFFYKAFTEKANKGYAYMKRRDISPAILKSSVSVTPMHSGTACINICCHRVLTRKSCWNWDWYQRAKANIMTNLETA